MARRRWKFSDSTLGFILGQLAHQPVALLVLGLIIGAGLAIAFIH